MNALSYEEAVHKLLKVQIKEGEEVWLDTTNIKILPDHPKLKEKRTGPFKIRRKLSNWAYELELPEDWKIHPVFHASRLTRFITNVVHGPAFAKPPPDTVEREEEYEVDTVIRHRTRMVKKGRRKEKRREFLIHWKGYSRNDASWVDEKDLSHAQEALDQYKKRKKLT